GGNIVGPFGETSLDMAARRLNFALRKQHGGQQMIEHGIGGLAGETLLAELARFLALAGIKGGGGATNDVLGAVLGHGRHIRAKEWVCKEGAHLAPRAGGGRIAERSGGGGLSASPAVERAPHPNPLPAKSGARERIELPTAPRPALRPA